MEWGNGSDEATLEYTFKYNPPMDLAAAEKNLKEAKRILDRLGVVFLLFSGTCLGATRDRAFIPWDDDIDLVSVVGINGLTDGSIDGAVAAFRDNGYFTREMKGSDSRSISMVKDYVRVGWECSRVIGDNIYAYPGIPIPAKFFTQPKEIEFLGEQVLVPNPPEEYLRLKYGAEWMIPKRAGVYEKDVVDKIPAAQLVGRPSWIRVFDHADSPVSGAEVVLVGGSHATTNERGYAEVIIPGLDWYALVVRYPGHEQVLYMEEMEPDRTYAYRPSLASTSSSEGVDAVGTLGNILALE